jgi:nitroreductase
MDVMEAIRTNLAVREFKPEKVPKDVIIKILEEGRLAHSSKKTQPWRFIVVDDRDKLSLLSKTTPTGAHIANAAFAIALFMENAKLPEVDGARAMEDMMLAAWSLGVGSCWITNFDDEKVKQILNAPKEWKLITVAPFGYPVKPARKGKKRRKALEEIAYYNAYGNPISRMMEQR